MIPWYMYRREGMKEYKFQKNGIQLGRTSKDNGSAIALVLDLAMTRTVGPSSRPATRPSGGEGRRLTTLTAPEGHKIFGGSPAKRPSRPAYA